MEEKKKFKNNLTIDFCDGFLRVGKGVVKSLGTPCYISLMINDEKKILAVMAADKEGVMTFKVPEGFLDINNKSFRIHSKGFVGIIAEMLNISKKVRIKLVGTYDVDMDAVVFDLDKFKYSSHTILPEGNNQQGKI